MYPVLYDFGAFPLGTWGPILAIGLLLGLALQRRHGAERGLDPNKVQDFSVYGFLAGFVGARLMYIAQNMDAIRAHPSDVFSGAGFVWYGGILAATPTAYLLARRAKMNGWRALDAIAPGVMLGLAIGRVGCLMAGCDHGRVVTSGPHWWTLTFTDPRSLVEPALLGKPLYPTQPMLSAKALLVFAILLAFRNRLAPWPGALALLMFICYAPLRFLVEFYRGDETRRFLLPGLSTSQAIGIAVLPIAVALFLQRVRRPPEPLPAPFVRPER